MKKQKQVPHDDAAFVRDPDNWPCWPYLPVKRRTTSLENKDLGILWIGTQGLTVHHVYLFALPKTVEEFKSSPKTEYDSVDAMLADGWVVD